MSSSNFRRGALLWLFLGALSMLLLSLPWAGASLLQGMTASAQNGSSVRFAVIGDFGSGSQAEADVAERVKSWNPAFIITAGDNRYGSTTYDEVVGQFYCEYLKDAGSGSYCSGGTASVNAFFPSIGNHEYTDGAGIDEYLSYFTLPGVDHSSSTSQERYYDFVWGPVHFFVLNSDSREPDGNTSDSVQGQWLQEALAGSTARWQVVYFHHAAYSSGSHGSSEWMQWPFEAWGADAVIGGHDHTYERLQVGGIPYFVNGLGGMSIYDFGAPLPESEVRYNGDYGAMLVDANETSMTFQFITRGGVVVDSYTYPPEAPTPTPSPTPTLGASGALDVRVRVGEDDVEELLADGSINMTSTDLELGKGNGWPESGDQPQKVGIRFQEVRVPQGARITSAYLEFETDEVSSEATNVTIYGEASDDAAAFTTEAYGVSNRVKTAASVGWDVPAWETVDEKHRSPDVSVIVQEIVNRSGWSPGNSMVFIIEGSGKRVAESYNGEAAAAPLLHIEYGNLVSTQFQDGVSPDSSYHGTRDAYISQADPDVNYGSAVTCLADGDDPSGSGQDKSVLLRWDLRHINPGEQIDAASITLNIENETDGPYELYELKRDWVEDQVTWNVYRAGANWAAPGAGDTASDRGDVILGVLRSAGVGQYTFDLNADGLAVIQGWVNDPDTNFGFILTNTNTTNGVDFSCRETATAGNRPSLFIRHTQTVANPDVATTLDAQNPTDVVLSWVDDDLNCRYEIYRQLSPYFDPDLVTPETVLDSPASSYTFANDAGNPDENHYYLVRALSCDSTTNAHADSNQTGSFDFSLVPGASN